MKLRRGRLYVAAALVAATCRVLAGIAGQSGGLPFTVQPLNASGIYEPGAKAGWTFTAPAGASPHFTYTLKKNGLVQIQGGSLDLSSGKAVISVQSKEPMMLLLEVSPEGSQEKFSFGAAISPTGLKPVEPKPRDFDSFWKSKINLSKAIPSNPVLTPEDSGNPKVDLSVLSMDHVNGTHAYGYLAVPKMPGKHPALLILQWASPPYPLQKSWSVDRAAEGWLTLNLEPHDVLPNQPKSYYDALPATIKNYASIGQDDREKSYFLQMYLADYRAADYLTSRSDWDGTTLVVTGGSMGGQQSLAVAGLHPKITHLVVEEPAGCDMNGPLFGRAVSYPFFPANNPKVMETARYFDPINFASHIKATSLVAMGFIDTVAAPAGIWTAFNEIKGPKEAAPMVEAAHNNIATYQQQMPYYSRYGAWLWALVHGQTVDVHASK